MGAWGAGSFENDGALDWTGSLEGHDDAGPLADVFLDLIERDSDSRDVTICCRAVAAAELVAASFFRHVIRSSSYCLEMPASAEAYVKRLANLPSNIEAAAVKAVTLICDNSELRQLWEENTIEFETWLSNMSDLLERLPCVPVFDELPPKTWITPQVTLASGFKPEFKSLNKDAERYVKAHGSVCRDEYESYGVKAYDDALRMLFSVYLNVNAVDPLLKQMKHYDWSNGYNEFLERLTDGLANLGASEQLFELWDRVLKEQSVHYRRLCRDSKKYPDEVHEEHILAGKSVLLQTLARMTRYSRHFGEDERRQKYWEIAQRVESGKAP